MRNQERTAYERAMGPDGLPDGMPFFPIDQQTVMDNIHRNELRFIPAKPAAPRRPQLRSRPLRNWVVFLAFLLGLTVPSNSQAQQCSCNDQRVDQACTIEDKISDPFGLVQTITKQSTCSVLKRVCSGACEANPTGGLPTVGGTCSSLLQTARETQQRVSNIRRNVWSKVHSAAQNIGVDATRDVVLYNLAAQASFTYNAYAGTAWYQSPCRRD